MFFRKFIPVWYYLLRYVVVMKYVRNNDYDLILLNTNNKLNQLLCKAPLV